MKKRVLVTGATGFIGRNALTPLVAYGYEVHAVYNDIPLPNMPEVHWHQANLLEASDTTKVMSEVEPTHLLHFAWYAAPGAYWTSPLNRSWQEATKTLLAAFKESGGARAVCAGTCAEYDWTLAHNALSEDSPLKPSTLYGQCKNETHLWAEEYSKKNGLSFAWGRIFFLFGENEAPQRLVPSVVNALLKKEPALCSSGEQVRDFLIVDDVAAAFCALLQSPVEGAVNIGSGEAIAVKDIILSIADMLDGRELVHLGARPTAENEPAQIVADIDRLKNEVGWQPEYSLQEGLAKTVTWWKENGSTSSPQDRAQDRYSSQ